MIKKIGITFCCLLAAFTIPGADKKVKPPVQKPLAAVAAPAELYLPPLITKANCKCLASSGQFEVFGKCFGSSQGNRVLRVNGTALPTVLAWQNKTIRCAHAYDFPGGVTVHVDLFDTAKNKRVSNLFDYLLPFCIYQQDPAGPLKQKSHVTLLVKPDVGVAAAGRRVMIGGVEAHADWMVHKIVFVVPLMTPGSYTLRLKKDGQLISNEFLVTIE
ncbi:MAG TPA: hypothetical protein VMZ49_04325 [Patescibacteria group bacterium]|nr:hypothetical protein [Patescibacteria group bacterium]